MNTSLSTFMKVALTAVVVTVLLFGVLYTALQDKTNEYEDHIRNLQVETSN